MEFEYHTFEVESFLESGQQPSFTMKNLKPTGKYVTLVNPETMEVSLTTSNSEGVRVPVFAVVTQAPEQQAENVRNLNHGSLLVAMGMENAMRFVSQIDNRTTIEKVVIVMATNCHQLQGGRYRAYFGITAEVA